MDVCVSPAARMVYGNAFEKINYSYETDIVSVPGSFDHSYAKEINGMWTDMPRGGEQRCTPVKCGNSAFRMERGLKLSVFKGGMPNNCVFVS